MNNARFRWNQRHLPRDIRLFLNTAAPTRPLPERYFDVLTAFSVFTHIDMHEAPWLLELRRILRPGGLIYLTVHDESWWENKAPRWVEVPQRSSGGANLTAESPFPGPRSAYHWRTDSFYSCNVVHSRDYIDRQWGRYFEILELNPMSHGQQCAVLLTYDD